MNSTCYLVFPLLCLLPWIYYDLLTMLPSIFFMMGNETGTHLAGSSIHQEILSIDLLLGFRKAAGDFWKTVVNEAAIGTPSVDTYETTVGPEPIVISRLIESRNGRIWVTSVVITCRVYL